MMRGKRYDESLCINFCHYYKPGTKKEELACQGAVVVLRLSERGTHLLRGRQGTREADPEHAAALREAVCSRCSFAADGCDFISTGGKAAPCGGFVLLSRCLGSQDVTIDEIISVL